MTLRLIVACLLLLQAMAAGAGMSVADYEAARTRVILQLQDGKFAELDAELNALQARFEQSGELEDAIWDAFKPFDELAPELADAEPQLRAWVERHPQSYAAHAALGIHLMRRARDARGGGYIRATSAAQLDAMQRWMEPAMRELKLSLTLSTRPLLSYHMLVTGASFTGADADKEAYYQAGIGLLPASRHLRALYLDRLKPRWGGSYAAMSAYTEQSAKVLARSADLHSMQAEIPADQADRAYAAGDLDAAERLYTAALELSDEAWLRCQRAWVRSARNAWDGVLEDLHHARGGEACACSCAAVVARFATRRADDPRALELLDAFIALNPRAGDLYGRRGWIMHQAGRHADALQDFLRGAELGDAYAQTMAGKYLFQGTGGLPADRERGLGLLQAAARQGDRNAQLSVTQALDMLGRKAEAEAARTRYAAMERAGAETGPARGAPPAGPGTDYYLKLAAAGAALLAIWAGIRSARRPRPGKAAEDQNP
ncbi:MAG: DUF4034 domain-containing protein [Rhodocyclaceae bacterium]|nr:DUF4034 domain-containing protein [Rhodocyclaceae bacterium]